MTLKLTNEMRDALRADPQAPVQVEDERTKRQYVLLPLEVYRRIRSILDDEFEISEMYAAQDEALAEVWDDPELDVYNNYDVQKPGS
jgi:hypothetical protein